jgi:hypothetical protein
MISMKYKVTWSTWEYGCEDEDWEVTFDQKDMDKAADLVFHLMLGNRTRNVDIQMIGPENLRKKTEEEGA